MHRVRRTAIGIALALVAVAVLEGTLEVFDRGTTGRLCKSPRGSTPGATWILNTNFWQGLLPNRPDLSPLPTSWSPHPAPGTLRIIVLGGSETAGFPDPGFAWPAQLATLLPTLCSNQAVEVVSLAFPGADSTVLRELARDLDGLHAHLWIIAAGADEFRGPFRIVDAAAGSRLSQGRTRLGLEARRYRLTRLLGGAGPVTASAAEPAPMAVDPEAGVTAIARFESNLRAMIRAGRDTGADVLVCIPPVNLLHAAPVLSPHGIGIAPPQQLEWGRHASNAVTLLRRGEWGGAFGELRTAELYDATPANLQYLLAQATVGIGRTNDASRHAVRALESDPSRVRPGAAIAEVIRRTVAASGPGVHVYDAARDVSAHAIHGVPGSDVFWDHVHPNPAGHHWWAAGLARQMAAGMLPPPCGGASELRLSLVETLGRLGFTPARLGQMRARVAAAGSVSPWNGLIDAADRDSRLWNGPGP